MFGGFRGQTTAFRRQRLGRGSDRARTLACIAAAVRLAAVKWPGSWIAVVAAGALPLVAFGTLSGLLFDLVGKLGPLRPIAGVTLGVLLLVAGTHASLQPLAYVDAPEPGEPVDREHGNTSFQAHPPPTRAHDNTTRADGTYGVTGIVSPSARSSDGL